MPVESRRFPDGESYIRFESEVKNDHAAIVQTTSPPQDEHLVQLLLMADNARDLEAKSITAVVPYLAYARQDGRFRPGEAFSIRTIVTLLKACGVGRIITVNSHNPALLETLPVPFEDLSAFKLLAGYLKKSGFDGAFALSMGKKGVGTAVEASKVLRGGCEYIPTQRDRVTGNVIIERNPLPLNDRDVVIFDDIISSGGTMVKAVSWIKEQGPRRIRVACVHPLLSGDVRDRILKSGAEAVVGTDSVPSPVSEVSVAPLIADALRK